MTFFKFDTITLICRLICLHFFINHLTFYLDLFNVSHVVSFSLSILYTLFLFVCLTNLTLRDCLYMNVMTFPYLLFYSLSMIIKVVLISVFKNLSFSGYITFMLFILSLDLVLVVTF